MQSSHLSNLLTKNLATITEQILYSLTPFMNRLNDYPFFGIIYTVSLSTNNYFVLQEKLIKRHV